MIAPALVILLAAQPAPAARGCLAATPQPGPGVVDPFRPPAPHATELNEAGKVLYRQEKWEQARDQYRAAEAADPTFLAPRLNVACSFVRQERFDEAAAEVKALLARAYVPWAREVLEAADLGALKVHPQMAEVKRTLAKDAAAWGAGLDESLIFVGRLRAPLHIPPTGAGQFILNPHQEVFAFTPATGRFRQLTAQDGHVVAVAVTPDRRRIVYVTAERFVRGAAPDQVTLDGVALNELTLATMSAEPPIPIAGSVRRFEIGGTPHGFVFHIDGQRTQGRFVIGAAHTLVPQGNGHLGLAPLAVLTAAGTLPVASTPVPGGCHLIARDRRTATGGREIELSLPGHGRQRRTLGGTHGKTLGRTIGETIGAGLAGLPLP